MYPPQVVMVISKFLVWKSPQIIQLIWHEYFKIKQYKFHFNVLVQDYDDTKYPTNGVGPIWPRVSHMANVYHPCKTIISDATRTHWWYKRAFICFRVYTRDKHHSSSCQIPSSAIPHRCFVYLSRAPHNSFFSSDRQVIPFGKNNEAIRIIRPTFTISNEILWYTSPVWRDNLILPWIYKQAYQRSYMVGNLCACSLGQMYLVCTSCCTALAWLTSVEITITKISWYFRRLKIIM